MLKAGFSRVDITPPMGTCIAGYYDERRADGVLDPLLATCLAVSDGENTALLFSIDIIGMSQKDSDQARGIISGMTGVPVEGIFLACTHTHTGPCVSSGLFELNLNYNFIMYNLLGNAAIGAIADLHETEVRVARGEAKGISFIRRYRMNDGSIRTNPGWGNPNVRCPIGSPDEMVQLVRLIRTGAPEINIVNFQTHPDVIGGTKFSADWPKFVRDTMEGALPGSKCIFFNGCQGDTNHIDISIDRKKSMDSCVPGFGYLHSQRMGRVIAGAALQVYDKALPVSGEGVRFGQTSVFNRANLPDPALIPHAKEIVALNKAGRDRELPFEGMELVTVVAEAYRMVRLENGPDEFDLHVTCVSFGDVAFAGLPGEPFTDIGRGIKEASPFPFTIPCCLTNGSEGYLPTYSAFAEGGYEARSSKFTKGIAEELVVGACNLLKTMR
ncbi:MAG: hypothetical protein IKM07_01695 [Clostridia bacterium]|nr:hypothetical protein [Clostridia bacterium]